MPKKNKPETSSSSGGDERIDSPQPDCEPPKEPTPKTDPVMSVEQYVNEFPESKRGMGRAFLIRSRTEQRKGRQFIQRGTRKELDAAFEKFIRTPVR